MQVTTEMNTEDNNTPRPRVLLGVKAQHVVQHDMAVVASKEQDSGPHDTGGMLAAAGTHKVDAALELGPCCAFNCCRLMIVVVVDDA